MSDNHSHADIAKHVKTYIMVFVALLIGTVLTVAVSYVNLGHGFNILVALLIACVKAALVAGFFMHLISEKTAIYAILASTVFFFCGLMFLTIWALHDFPANTVVSNTQAISAAAPAHATEAHPAAK
jgi:cytochrome c oxidase subunit 4